MLSSSLPKLGRGVRLVELMLLFYVVDAGSSPG